MTQLPHTHNAVIESLLNKNWRIIILDFRMCVFTDGLVVCHLPFGPTAYFTLYNVVMRHDVPDIGTMSEAYPHLIFHNFTSQLGKRVSAPCACTNAVDILLEHLFVCLTN